MFEIILNEPEIPPNTGNIIRLAANTGSNLHLIGPLGFELDEKRLRRAGLDYHEWVRVQVHTSIAEYLGDRRPSRLLTFSTRNPVRYDQFQFAPGDALLFGNESRGLPAQIRECVPQAQQLRLPLAPHNRSLNLSNAVAVAVYEAWRQCGFQGQQS